MQTDISQLPVVDTHCHFFNVEYVEHDLASIFNLSLNDIPQEDLVHTLAYRNAIKELGSFLGTKNSEEEALAERLRRMQKDYRRYVLDIIKDANIETLLIDVGFKPAHVDIEVFEKMMPVNVRYIYRIETVIDELWEQKHSFAHAEEIFHQALEEAFANPKFIAIKQLIGYRTGLDVKEVKRNYLTKGSPSEKEFRDYFFLRAAEKSIEKGYPIQIHTGFGESNIDMSTNNPLLLKGFLENSKYKEATVILLHGSYPYSFEAGFLGSVYPNVYLDLSAMNLFCPPYVFLDGIKKIFNMCPFSKVMYGSDGEIIPDTHWLGAKVAKGQLSRLFNEYVEDGLFDDNYVQVAARMILFETAHKVYNLNI